MITTLLLFFGLNSIFSTRLPSKPELNRGTRSGTNVPMSCKSTATMKKPRNSFHGYNVMPSALRKHTLSKQGYFCLFVRFFCHLCSSHAVSFSKFKAASVYSQFAEDRSRCSFKSGAGFAAIAFLILHSEHELWNKAELPFSGIITTQFSANTEEKVKSHLQSHTQFNLFSCHLTGEAGILHFDTYGPI